MTSSLNGSVYLLHVGVVPPTNAAGNATSPDYRRTARWMCCVKSCLGLTASPRPLRKQPPASLGGPRRNVAEAPSEPHLTIAGTNLSTSQKQDSFCD